MKDFDVIVTIGAVADSSEEALDHLSDILFFIKDNLPMENYEIDIVEKGEYL